MKNLIIPQDINLPEYKGFLQDVSVDSIASADAKNHKKENASK